MNGANTRRAAFLDRDGTLMEDSGFIGDPKRVRVLNGVVEALRRLAEAGYERVVVTNQSGVARGFFGDADVERVNAELARQLERDGASIDAFYFCSHLGIVKPAQLFRSLGRTGNANQYKPPNGVCIASSFQIYRAFLSLGSLCHCYKNV